MISEVLQIAIERKASDVILAPNNFACIKVDGATEFLPDFGTLQKEELSREILALIPENLKKKFSEELELDFGLNINGYGRFRANVLTQRYGTAIVFRIIQDAIPQFSSLGLPDTILKLTQRRSGLVLITGSVGSGKSTTLAALINEINKKYNRHIITIEDPVEYVHQSLESLVEQREVGIHTHSFDNGLKYALRQASDVIMVGEMRDLETFRLALRAAETGNLVFATLHSNGAASTISRIIDMFPGDEKSQIRGQISESLLGVVWQDLLKKKEGGRVAACEILINNTGIANMIRDDHIHQIDSAIETGRAEGMIPMKKYIEYLFKKEIISQQVYDNYLVRLGD